MAYLKKKKRNSNNSFLLSVILMVCLIVTLLIPTAMAWFTDSDTGSSNTPINFGTVDINVEQNNDGSAKVNFTNLNSGARALEAVLPGDSIEFSFNVVNTGNVDTYAKVSFAPKIMYGETDITPLLYDTTTDPINQPYWIIDNTNNTTDNPDFYVDGDPDNQVFVLATGETKQIKGVLQFSTKLPNSVTDGTNPPYQLNGHEKGLVKLVLDIDMAAIQKDNLDLDVATPELNKYVDSMAINYSFTYLNSAPTLTVAGKPVETTNYYSIGLGSNSKIYAFTRELEDKNILLAVVGEGNMKPYTYSAPMQPPWTAVRENITEITIQEGITNIGQFAFYNCVNLKSITIPNSVTIIGQRAFAGCKSLQNITIPNDVSQISAATFTNCSSLSSIFIPNKVQSIGDFAFSGCTGLTSISLGSNVQSINLSNDAFKDCPSLTNITVDANNQTYYSQNNCVIEKATETLILGGKTNTIPNNVQTIGPYAFNGRTTLTDIVIPNNVQTVSEGAFNSCINLTNLSIGNNVQRIIDVFTNCPSLTNITVDANNQTYYSQNNCVIGKASGTLILGGKTNNIPNNVKIIREDAFKGHTTLTDIIIPDSVQEIERNAFYGCTNLTSISLGNGLSEIKSSTFQNCTSLSSIIIPDSVQSIGIYAFRGCTNLTSISLSNNLSEIKSNTFQDCTSLTSIIIPDSVSSISNDAFCNCTSLTSIRLSNTMQYIGANAFDNCTSLSSIIIPISVVDIGETAFYGCPINIFMENTTDISNTFDRNWLISYTYINVYWYSETEQAGCWHWLNNDPTTNTPVLW